MRRRRVVLVAAATCSASLATGCAHVVGFRMPKGAQATAVEAGVQRGYEAHGDVERCRDFILTKRQVRLFLDHARVITPREEHDQFNWAPCVARGKIEWASGEARFEIDAALVGSVVLEDGREVRLGCDGRCERMVHPPATRP